MQHDNQHGQIQIIFQNKEQLQQYITNSPYHDVIKFQPHIINETILVYNGYFEQIFRLFCTLKQYQEQGKIYCLDINLAVINQQQMQQNIDKVLDRLSTKQDELKQLDDNQHSREILRAKMQVNSALRSVIDRLKVREK